MGAGESVWFLYPIVPETGTLSITVTVDTENEITEMDEDNNDLSEDFTIKSTDSVGDYALSVRALKEGARPGASCTVQLDAGTYEVRYWACAGFEKTATIGVHLSGQDLPERTVGDEWKQFKQTVEIGQKNRMASPRLWSSAPNIRVLFDDVEVEWVR